MSDTTTPTTTGDRAAQLATIEVPEHTRNYPEITGLSEVHIFLAPLDPDADTVARYQAAVDEYNEVHAGVIKQKMKGCYLCLSYRDAGDVSVMQSSRYVYADNTATALAEAYYDGKWFSDRGFEVVRHKIECLASGAGVPVSDSDAEAWPDRYFEFHIRVRSTDHSDAPAGAGEAAPETAISDDEVAALKDLADAFTAKFETPVPLSFNRAKAGQRYLNVRFQHMGSVSAKARVKEIVDSIAVRTPSLEWVKSISEYVWYDDNRAMDSGWIDFE